MMDKDFDAAILSKPMSYYKQLQDGKITTIDADIKYLQLSSTTTDMIDR